MIHPSSTLVELARQRSHHHPDRSAFTFLVDGETETATITYADLDRRARAIAAELIRSRLTGERVLLLYQPSLDYIAAFFGCLYAGVVAVPAYPPKVARLDRSLPRLQAIVEDAQPAAALTTSHFLTLGAALGAKGPAFQQMCWIATDTLDLEQADAWRMPHIDANTLAFLQYTSGSTATPKGVMLTHGNLLHNLALIHKAFGTTASSHGVIWLPPYHDMGLIGGILQPLYGGFCVTLMSPVNFLQRPIRWLEAISRTGATTSGGPNFAYDLCVRKTTPEQRASLDLSSWQVAFSGAEPIRPDTLRRFTDAFAPAGFRPEAFYPCYGLAESTLIVSGSTLTAQPIVRSFQTAALEQHKAISSPAEDADQRTLVGCGQILGDQRVAIVDPATRQRCESEQIGEIWVASGSVAQGYWNRQAETEQVFQAHIAGSGEGPFLRTGDLGFMEHGELFVTGRLKDLIIIRGRNHYPQDLELTVERSHAAIRPSSGAAFAVDVDGQERLVIVQEIERLARTQSLDPIIDAIRAALAEQDEVQAYAIVLIKPGSIPKTSSGKIQRHRCRAAFLAGALDILGSSIADQVVTEDDGSVALSRDELLASDPATRLALLETYLQRQLARLLQVPDTRVDPQASVSALGLDSLMAIEWQHTIEENLGVSIPMTHFLEGVSIGRIATDLLVQIETPAAFVEASEPTAPSHNHEYPLSVGQRAIWFLHQLAPESSAYTIAAAVRIRPAVDVPTLRRSFQLLVDRHPLLRSTFSAARGEPIQRVHQHSQLWLHEIDASTWDETALASRLVEEAQRPFDLEHGPLLKVHLFRRGPGEHVLLLVIHHIIADFWSLAVLTQELGVIYPAVLASAQPRIAPLAREYADVVARQTQDLAGPDGDRLWSYWQQQLAGELPVLNLPTDRPRPNVQTYCGATQPFQLSAALTEKLKELSRAHEATLYTTLLAAFQVLLYRYTGQTDLLVGSPTAGRHDAEVARIVGYFVNPVVLRGNLAGNPSFSTCLGRTRQTVLGALAHQAYPFPLLAQRLQPERDPGRSPLFQAMFTLQKAHLSDIVQLGAFTVGERAARLNIGGLSVEPMALEQLVAQFDLSLVSTEVEDRLVGSFQYNTDLFDSATIARMAAHWQILLEGIAADWERPIGSFSLLTEAEREQLRLWNQTALDFSRERCLHELFAEQAARTPDATAVICPGTDSRPGATARLTYAELNRRADQVARYLRTLGVGPEVTVGLYLERSLDLVIGMLGVLKAGGAYVPLDPAYPQERLAFVLADARMPVVLTQESLVSTWSSVLARSTAEDPALERNTQQPSIVCLDRDWSLVAQARAALNTIKGAPDQLAYVIYTSGSTGRPKGVAITHQSAVALLAWASTVYSSDELAGVLAATSICFDLSIFELFTPLTSGGSVILVDNVLQLPALPADINVTLINTVPSALTELLRLSAVPPTAQTINLAGEPLPQRLVQQIAEHATVKRIYNLYGPSEDTTYSTFALIERDDQEPTIGRPIVNTQAYVLDAARQPVPLGVAGELYLAGDGLARGYLNRPDLTAERFVPNPFTDAPGKRMYRTGDLARFLPDGEIAFLGRIDQQVKIRGFRIELGEIEATLAQHEAVQDCVVMVYRDEQGDNGLVAYVVAEEQRAENREQRTENKGTKEQGNQFLASDELRQFLQTRLPAYMIPSLFVTLAALPLTPNGKLDRRALPLPDRSRRDLRAEVAPPRTPLEAALVDMWAQLLGVERVGIHDNFFQLGGHSLLVTRMVVQLRETLELELPIHSLFETPTIADLAKRIETIRWVTQNTLAPRDELGEDIEEGTL